MEVEAEVVAAGFEAPNEKVEVVTGGKVAGVHDPVVGRVGAPNENVGVPFDFAGADSVVGVGAAPNAAKGFTGGDGAGLDEEVGVARAANGFEEALNAPLNAEGFCVEVNNQRVLSRRIG